MEFYYVEHRARLIMFRFKIKITWSPSRCAKIFIVNILAAAAAAQ